MVAWLAFLGYQSVLDWNAGFVSRPQILLSPIGVIGTLLPDPPRVRVAEVWWGSGLAPEQEVELADFEEVLEEDRQVDVGRMGGRVYLFPLEPTPTARYRVAPVPTEPELATRMHRPRIYPATRAVRRQVEILRGTRDPVMGPAEATQNDRGNDEPHRP